MEAFIGVFIYCFPAKKRKTENLIYMIEVWLLLEFIWLEIFCNEESSILCTIRLSGVIFGGALERQSRKLFVHQEMGSNSKNIRAAVKNRFSAERDQTFLKVHAKNLAKVTGTGDVMGRNRPPTLGKLSFNFSH